MTLQSTDSPARATEPETGRDRVYSTALLIPLLEGLAEHGIEARNALRGTHIWPEIINPKTMMSAEDLYRIYANLSELAPQPDFAFQLGLGHHLSSYGMYGFAVLSCSTFGQAVELILAYGRAVDTPAAVRMIVSEDGRSASFTIEPFDLADPQTSLYQFVVDLRGGQMLALCRDLLGERFMPTRLTVVYRPDQPGSRHVNLPGCDIVYGAPDNRFAFDAQTLAARLEHGNPVTRAALIDLCDQMLLEFDLQRGLSGRVRALLAETPGRRPGFQEVAEKLGLSPRTLRRKLIDEGTSFTDLADEYRLSMAMKYLEDTDLKVETIADALGFSDSASFRRSLARHTGLTPKQIKKSVRA